MSELNFRAVLLNRCAACSKGSFFVKRWYQLKSFTRMHPECPECRTNFRQGPGFYFGAAFVSYFVQIFLFIGMFLVFEYILEFPFWYYVGAVIIVQLLLMPLVFRFSRLMWFMLFGTYTRK